MKTRLPLFILAFVAIGIFLSDKSLASTSDETYAPIPELSFHENTDETSVFDEMRLHAGASFVNSYTQFKIGNNVSEKGNLRGLQLNIGMDLFNEHWIVEGLVQSMPEMSVGDTKISSNGFELRL